MMVTFEAISVSKLLCDEPSFPTSFQPCHGDTPELGPPTRGFPLMFDAHALDHVLVPIKANPAFPTSFPCSLWQRPVSFATKDLFPFGIFVVFFTKSTLLRCKMLIKKH